VLLESPPFRENSVIVIGFFISDHA
jgi:hypothetical protein